MCTGTVETAVYIKQKAPKGTTVYGVDMSVPMMTVAKKKDKGIHFTNAVVLLRSDRARRLSIKEVVQKILPKTGL